MAENDNRANAGLVIGVGAAALAAWAALRSRGQVSAAGVVTLDDATMQLLIAIAAQTGKIDDIITAINDIAIPGGSGSLGAVPNTDGITASRLQIAALNTPYQLPDIPIPDGMELLIKAWPNALGIIYVSKSSPEATNVNQVWPLIANEMVAYKVKNANCIWVSGTVAGDFVGFTVEQRST